MNRDEIEVRWHRFVAATWCRVFGHRYTVRRIKGYTCSACNSFTYRRSHA